MANHGFQPVKDFTFDINRAERTQQVRRLVQSITSPRGRAWFLHQLDSPCSDGFHVGRPLRRPQATSKTATISVITKSVPQWFKDPHDEALDVPILVTYNDIK